MPRHHETLENVDELKAECGRRKIVTKPLLRRSYLVSLELEAKTIFDVGVRWGTRALYRAFPDRQFFLIDPQVEKDAILIDIPEHYTFLNVAVGAAEGRAILTEYAGNNRGMATIKERTALTATMPVAETYEIEITTLDSIIDRHKPEPPFGLKIDTEGYELEVLAGLTNRLDQFEFIICEASVRKRFVDGYTFAELVAAVHAKGFEFYNILSGISEKPRYYDCLFLRRDHRLFD
jgi:FkbM family methyltransferase